MDKLRLILIGAGILVLAGIYLFGLLAVRRRRARREAMPDEGHPPEDFLRIDPEIGDLDGEEFIERIRDHQAAHGAVVREGTDDPPYPTPAAAIAEDATEVSVSRVPATPAPAPAAEPAPPPPVVPAARVEQQDLFDDLAGLSALGGEVEPEAPALGAVPGDAPADRKARAPGRKGRSGGKGHKERAPDEPGPAPLVVALTVMARSGGRLEGAAVRSALNAEGLEHGAMQIFHHRPRGQPRGTPPDFSVANVVKPGTFDTEAMDAMTTPGLALFLQVPGPRDAGEAFERMLGVGRRLAERLGAVLCDETRSTLTGQSVNHLRERIAEHTRRTRLKR